MEKTELAKRLFDFRAKYGLSMREAAPMLGVSYMLIYRFESGQKIRQRSYRQIEIRLNEMEQKLKEKTNEK